MASIYEDGNGFRSFGFKDRKVNPKLYFYDDFTEPTTISWKVSAGTGTLAKTTTANEFNSGNGAMKLTTSTVSAAVCTINKWFGLRPGMKKVEFGGIFSISDENLQSLEFRVGFRDGTNFKRGLLRHTYTDETWAYDAGEAGAAAMTTLLTRDPSELSGSPRWHQFRVVIDLQGGYHVAMSIDDQEFDSVVSAKLLRSSADATIPNILDFAIETVNITGTPVASIILFDELWGIAY